MNALSVHGGGALFVSISFKVGRLAEAKMARLVGREVVMTVSPSHSSALEGGRGDPDLGLGDGLRYVDGECLRIRDLFISSAQEGRELAAR